MPSVDISSFLQKAKAQKYYRENVHVAIFGTKFWRGLKIFLMCFEGIKHDIKGFNYTYTFVMKYFCSVTMQYPFCAAKRQHLKRVALITGC